MEPQPCAAAQRPERRLHLYDELLDVVVHHQPWRQADQEAYAYEIHVTKSWNNVEEVYEDVFDSYSMDLNTFKRQLQARLSEYNDNEEGYVYYIGSDARRYYQATDAAKLKGVESVTISVTCFGRCHPRTGQHAVRSAVSAAVRSMPTARNAP